MSELDNFKRLIVNCGIVITSVRDGVVVKKLLADEISGASTFDEVGVIINHYWLRSSNSLLGGLNDICNHLAPFNQTVPKVVRRKKPVGDSTYRPTSKSKSTRTDPYMTRSYTNMIALMGLYKYKPY